MKVKKKTAERVRITLTREEACLLESILNHSEMGTQQAHNTFELEQFSYALWQKLGGVEDCF